jgi:hypothetical protein
MDLFKLDKTVVSKASLSDPTNDKEYWLTKTPHERLQVVEYLRRLNYGEAQCTARLQGVLGIAQRSSG